MNLNEYLSHFVGQTFDDYAQALTDLTPEQWHFLPNDSTCHIGFHAWHFVRTADNVINFICQNRKAPVWVRQELPDKWALPKVAQGTGMELAEARALRLPSLEGFLRYLTDVRADISPYLATASEEELQTLTRIAQWGDRPKAQQIGQTIIAHGNQHLGQIRMLRSLLALPGDTM